MKLDFVGEKISLMSIIRTLLTSVKVKNKKTTTKKTKTFKPGLL